MSTTGLKHRRQHPLWRRLAWLLLGRVVIITLLLGGTVLVRLERWESLTNPFHLTLYALVVTSYLASIASALAMRLGLPLTVVAWTQLAIDLLLTSGLVYITGVVESPLVFLYSLVIIYSSIILYRRGALLAAALASIGLGLVSLLVAHGVLPMPFVNEFGNRALLPEKLVWPLFTNVTAFFVVALLSSYVAEQLRGTRERLVRSTIDLADLTIRHREIIGSLESGVITTDERGRITFSNPRAQQLLGLPLTEVFGLPLGSLFPRVGADVSPTRLIEPEEWQETFTTPGDATRYLGCTLSRLTDHQHEPIGAMLMVQDQTRLKQMEHHLVATERLAAVGELAAGLAHEIRNPLASLSGAVQMMQEMTLAGADRQRLMDIVLREVNRLDTLIGELLRYARPSTPTASALDLAELARETLEIFAHSEHVDGRLTLDVVLDQPLPTEGDPAQLRQVLWNLLLNAAQASPPGGRIEVRGDADSSERVAVTMSDEGPGVPAEVRQQIFEPFYTTRPDGTGLGLAIAYRIIESHRGALRLAVRPEPGATFRIELPRRRSPDPTPEATG